MKLSTKKTNSSIKFNLQLADLERQFVQPYKDRIKELERLVNKRNKYIYSLHSFIKDKKLVFYASAACLEAIKILPKELTVSRMNILCFLYQKDMVRKSSLLRISKNLRLGKTKNTVDIKNLLELNLIGHEQNNLFFITDKGREFVEYYEAKVRADTIRLLKENLTAVSFAGATKFSMEERELRRERYMKLMKPFWEAGIKKIPKNIPKRIEILSEYIKKHPKSKDYYLILMTRWSAKN